MPDRPFDVTVSIAQPVSLAEVGEVSFHEIGPESEPRSDAAGSD